MRKYERIWEYAKCAWPEQVASQRKVECEREREEGGREGLASWRAAASWPSGWDVVCTKPTKGNNSEPLIKNNMTAIKLNLLPKCRQAARSLPPFPLSLTLSLSLSLSLFLSLSVCVYERITTQAVGHQGSLSVGIRIRRVCRAKQTNERYRGLRERSVKRGGQGNRLKHRSGKTSERISCCHFICQFLFLFQLQLSF